jgi:hypothetical protein
MDRAAYYMYIERKRDTEAASTKGTQNEKVKLFSTFSNTMLVQQ